MWEEHSLSSPSVWRSHSSFYLVSAAASLNIEIEKIDFHVPLFTAEDKSRGTPLKPKTFNKLKKQTKGKMSWKCQTFFLAEMSYVFSQIWFKPLFVKLKCKMKKWVTHIYAHIYNNSNTILLLFFLLKHN